MLSENVFKELTAKLNEIKIEKEKAIYEYDKKIAEFENAIMILSDNKNYAFYEEVSHQYDDQSPDYIRGTEDGI